MSYLFAIITLANLLSEYTEINLLSKYKEQDKQMSDNNSAGLALVAEVDNLFQDFSPDDESTIAGGWMPQKSHKKRYKKHHKKHHKKRHSGSYSKSSYSH